LRTPLFHVYQTLEYGGCELTEAVRTIDLIETMAFDPSSGIANLEQHLERMKASAAELGFTFDRHLARNELQAATFRCRDARKIRLLLSPSGQMAIECRSLPKTPSEPVDVALALRSLASDDQRLCHKTSERTFYDEARAKAGTYEVVFVDQDGFVTEGSFTNIFVERGDRLLTPPASRGLLRGVLRRQLIEEGRAEEADLRPENLRAGFFIGNAVRGLIAAKLVE
jgi:para-aminobenzoate synthetase/4-amino-4-deoxychorismate lyase